SASPAPSRTTAGHPRARATTRSNSESASSKGRPGEDFDMNEYEVLSTEQCESQEMQFFPTEPPATPTTPDPPATPSAPPLFSAPGAEVEERGKVEETRASPPHPKLPPPRVLRLRPRSKSAPSVNSGTM
ncbi:hypothetical protein JZ751_025630, partial [Albula glossodonta]